MTRLFPAAAAAVALGFAATPAHAAEWTVDHGASRLGVLFTQQGSEIEARFADWTADIIFDPEALDGAKAVVEVDLASFDSGSRDRDTQVEGSAFFDVGESPTAVFQTTGFTRTGDGAYEATADLTIKGATQPVVLPFTLTIDGDTALMAGELILDRTAFSVGTGDFSGDGTVGHDVRVIVDLTATR